MARGAIALAALALLAGCGGTAEDHSSTAPPPAVVPPAQASALLAAARLTTGTPHSDLITVSPDGDSRLIVGTPRSIEPPVGGVDAPEWTPDAKAILFAGSGEAHQGENYSYSESDVYRADLEGAVTQVTRLGDVSAVAPAPEGETLLLVRVAHPGTLPFASALWLADADGSSPERLFEEEDGLDLDGSWSPNGGTIAFTHCESIGPDEHGLMSNDCAVYAVSRDGSDLRKLADRAREPAFSPDGKRIAFVSDRDGNGRIRVGEDEDAVAMELYAMNADGSEQKRLTETEELSEGAPAWSPDGTRVAYQAQGATSFGKELRLTDPDGSCSVTIVGDAQAARPGNAWYTQPAWRPGRVTGAPPALSCG